MTRGIRARRVRGHAANHGRTARERARVIVVCLLLAGAALTMSVFIASVLRFDAVAAYRNVSTYLGHADDVPHGEREWEALGIDGTVVIGWIRVADTTIDHPIVQAVSDDPEYYLDHAPDGSFRGEGTIYVDSSCDGLEDTMPLVYGHHMRMGGMFSDFARYTDEDYARAHEVVELFTPDGQRTLHVIGVDEVDADVSGHARRTVKPDEVAGIADDTLDGCDIVLDRPKLPRRLYTFCTCGYGTDNIRVLVYAVEYPSS